MGEKLNSKMARIEKLQATDAKSAMAERKQKMKELAERQMELRKSFKARPITAEAKKNNRAFI